MDMSAQAQLVQRFTESDYNAARYSHWPLGRQVHAFLADEIVEDYDAAFITLYARVRAARRESEAAV